MRTDKRIWFITGVSSGLGAALAEAVIQSGDFVIGTFRHSSQIDTFNDRHGVKGLGIQLDVTNAGDIQKAFDFVTSRYGRLDVLVNNAGVGFAGAVEETTKEECKAVFDANFFGVMEITNTFLPMFRQQQSGHIVQISSHGGIKAFAGFGIYNASKFALEGLSEALAQEMAPLGIKVTIVEPGPFRTHFAGDSLKFAGKEIADYKDTAGTFREKLKSIDGKQEGDPVKAADAIVQIVNAESAPLRLPLGKIALVSITAKIQSIQNDIDAYSDLARSAVY